MIQTILRVSILLFGYLLLGIGFISAAAAFKLLFDVFPELLFAQVFGFLVLVAGFWVLGKAEKIGRPR